MTNGFTLKVNELLNPTEESKKLFAQFLANLRYFQKLGAEVNTDIQIPDGAFYITYYVTVSSFSIIVSQINDFLRHYASRKDQSEFAIASFEDNFDSDLKMHNCNIKDEISLQQYNNIKEYGSV